MKDRLSKNMIVNLLMFIALALTSISGYLLKVVIRRSTGINSILGMGRGVWRDIHTWAGIVVVVLLAIHIHQHNSMIGAWFSRHIPHRPTRIAVYVLLSLLLIATVVPWLYM